MTKLLIKRCGKRAIKHFKVCCYRKTISFKMIRVTPLIYDLLYICDCWKSSALEQLNFNPSLIWPFASNIVPGLHHALEFWTVFLTGLWWLMLSRAKKKKVGHPACSVPNPTRLHMFTMCTQGFHLPIFQHALRLLCIFCSLTQCCNFDGWQVSKALIYSKSYCSQSNFDDFKHTSELKSARPILHAPLCHYKQSTSDCTSDSVHRL